jgi:hypothetical protein
MMTTTSQLAKQTAATEALAYLCAEERELRSLNSPIGWPVRAERSLASASSTS